MEVNVLSNTAFNEIIKGAGVILTTFDPTDPEITDEAILFATSGGINATAVPTFKDYGEDIDNCPKNTKEFKKIDSWECKISGTASTITASGIKKLGAAADITGSNVSLRNDLQASDFSDLWWVGEKTADDTVCYVKLSNALSTGGISIQTTDKEKGKFAFEFTGHYSTATQSSVPFAYGELVVAGAANAGE